MGYYGTDCSKCRKMRFHAPIQKGELSMLMFAAAAPAAQGDPVALAMVLVLGVIVAVMAWKKRLSKKNAKTQKPAEAPAVPAAPAAPAPDAPGSAGHLKLHDVEPKTAAMVMAIVADKLGKPLNELRFVSIKEVK